MDVAGNREKPVKLCILEEHVEILAHQIPQGKEIFSIIKASLRKVDEAPVGTARNEHWRLACQSYLRNVSKTLSWVTFRRQILYREAQADLWNKTKSFDHTFTKSRIPRAAIQIQKETALLAQATARKERDDPELTLEYESQSEILPDSDSTTIVPDRLEVQSSNVNQKNTSSDKNEPQPRESQVQAVDTELRNFKRTLQRDQAKMQHMRKRMFGQRLT
ncbi:hypothetical protein HYFRA_00004512 [Hymenoscyphus fraxineus]|uniref:Uncharacterized protein n=1 Tax=Hymenoscyphus fraxineus TaxID=746836 RepID=A0A9N9KUP2_9HELO|nr:hypothetical protein HYFRA_00004512 [Hymenoscyphus fraxineus]